MDIFTDFEEFKSGYESRNIELFEGLSFSQYDTLKKIKFYSEDTYLTGESDNKGRKKPFFNILNSAVNVAIRTTDFDTKDIRLMATAPKFSIHSLLLSKELLNWMRDENFAETLNIFTETRPRYGGVILKRKESSDKLDINVVAWKNVMTDQVDIEGGIIAEKHYMSQVELAKKRKVWSGLDENWGDIMELFEKKDKEDDEEDDKLEVIEIEGELRRIYIDEEADPWEFSVQRWFVIMDGDEFVLHSEEIKERNYKYLSWNPQEGRALGKGIVEEGFEAQRWVNHAKIQEMDVMEVASKVLWKTTDANYMDQSATNDYNTGDILFIEEGKDFLQLNTTSNSIPAFNNLVQSWSSQYEKSTSTFAAITGEELPSNTPLGSLEIQNQSARSRFDYERERAGIFLKEVIEDWVLPFIIKRSKKGHTILAQFDTDDLVMIDNAFSSWSANKVAIQKILNREVFTSDEYQAVIEGEKQLQALNKDSRFVEVPEGFYNDIEVKVEVITTNEQVDKRVALQSLSTILQTDPSVLTHPVYSKVFARMVELSGIGISPAQLIASSAKVQHSNEKPEKANLEGLVEAQEKEPATV